MKEKEEEKISCYIFLPNLASVFRMYTTLNFLNHRSNCIRSSSLVFGPLPESISAIAYTIHTKFRSCYHPFGRRHDVSFF